jgi:predicted secreted protein
MSVVTLDISGVTQDARARVGDTVILRIDENPTTGFMWHQVNPLPIGVVERDSEFSTIGSGVGAGGRRQFMFLCERAVSVDLEFHLSRPWEADKTIQKKNASITWR